MNNKLDEIAINIFPKDIESGYSYEHFDNTFKKLFRKAMIEFGKHLLKEAAENAMTKDEGCIGENGWESYEVVDKQSITDTINKYL